MTNNVVSDFNIWWSLLECGATPDNEQSVFDERSISKMDLDRISRQSSFRRLQDKAQVFPLERGDFLRTRLTHSIEVMFISEYLGMQARSGILNKIKGGGVNLNDYNGIILTQKIDEIPHILKAAALLHDIGNSPFGHISEGLISGWYCNSLGKIYFDESKWKNNIINEEQNLKNESISLGEKIKILSKLISSCWSSSNEDGTLEDRGSIHDILKEIKDFQFFDGNAQSSRVVTKLQKDKLHIVKSVSSSIPQLDDTLYLSYPVLATILKYPSVPRREVAGSKGKKDKYGLFTSESEKYTDIVKKLRYDNINFKNGVRHPLVYLLEASDDIAYLISDIEDSHKRGLITLDDLYACLIQHLDIDSHNRLRFPGDTLDKHDDSFVSTKNNLRDELSKYKNGYIQSLQTDSYLHSIYLHSLKISRLAGRFGDLRDEILVLAQMFLQISADSENCNPKEKERCREFKNTINSILEKDGIIYSLFSLYSIVAKVRTGCSEGLSNDPTQGLDNRQKDAVFTSLLSAIRGYLIRQASSTFGEDAYYNRICMKDESWAEEVRANPSQSYGDLALLSGKSTRVLTECFRKLLEEKTYYSDELVKAKVVAVKILTRLLTFFSDVVLHSYLDMKPSDTKEYLGYQLFSENFRHDSEEACRHDLEELIRLIDSFKIDICKFEDIVGNEHFVNYVYHRLQLVTDFISGMTDSYAKDIYREIEALE